jgi:hypothetical protein
MGVIGCYLGLRLLHDGVDFTWHDSSEAVNAWEACTGAIFPTGHADDLEALAVWRGHLDDPGFAPYMEEAAYVFSQKHPPHGGKYRHVELGPMRLAEERSLHLNAQDWVRRTRLLLANHQGPPSTGQRRVITHGFGPRLARFMWGWTVRVKVGFEPGTELVSGGHFMRPCIYCREGRFVMAYAYPVPGTELWYAGSSLISQRVPKRLDVEKHYRRWRGQFLRMTEGYVTGVARASEPIEGWRPVPFKDDTAWITEQPDGSLAARPLWHSGVRHAPHIYNALREVLQ